MEVNKSRSKKRLIVVLIAAFIVVILVGIFVFNRTNNQQANNNQAPQVTIEPSGITYPPSWVEATEISASEKEAGVTSLATKDKSATKVIVREVTGDLPSNFDIKKLPTQVVSQLSEQVEGFTLVDKRTIKLGEHDAVKVDYTQLNPDDQKEYNFVMFIVPTDKKTYYVTYSSAEELSKISDDITKINQSITQYITTRPN